jgi:undecaprenyl-diphosphatase
MTALQAVVMAILQGITELFPISSLGHAVLMPALLGWKNVDENGPGFLPFLVIMHLGTAIALLIYFWRDWFDFGMAVVVRRGPAAQAERKLFLQVVVATIPAVVIGGVLEHKFKNLFGSPMLVAGFLVANGIMLLVAERLKKLAGAKPIGALTWLDALVIGLWQCLALIPGFSRSGATMAGGYLAGLKHEDAARFSFLTATPIILGAVVLELPKMHKAGASFSHVAVISGVVAGVVAFISVAAIMRWFRDHEAKAFDPFGVYCIFAGLASLAYLKLQLGM